MNNDCLPCEKFKDKSIEKKVDCLDGLELARAYVPFQRMGEIFSPLESLVKGTVFPELAKPYKENC